MSRRLWQPPKTPGHLHSALSRSRRFNWLDTIVTGDEKWVLYVNHTQKRVWCPDDEMPDPSVKGEIHEKKVMLRVWWGVHGIYRFELLPDKRQLLLRSTALICKHCRQDPQGVPEARQRSPAAR
ncbi:hypothetical protein RB195_023057 [Necator americanus]|uniref:Uncharacterized protein n=1 Tax=Necator americanus TaxID=51031 RepID=A0ABR1EHP6_NECAM